MKKFEKIISYFKALPDLPKEFISDFKRADLKKRLIYGGSVGVSVLALIAILIILLRGCGKEAEIPASLLTQTPDVTATPTQTQTQTPSPEPATSQPTIQPTTEPTPEPEPEPTPYVGSVNIMTGEPLEEEIAKRRPVAVVINNVKKALPQSGISQASMYYEVLAEGDITRIIAVFQDFDASKIGSIRSTRPYFFNFAYDNDAVFVHHGASTEAYVTIRGKKIDSIDGQDWDGGPNPSTEMTFWRDPTRYQTSGMREHSSYSSAGRIFARIEKLGYRQVKDDDFKGMFLFYEEPTSPQNGTPCDDITVAYLNNIKAEFAYDAESGKYIKSQNGSPHIDIENGEQLSVTNIIIQQTRIYDSGDALDHRVVELVSSGKGYLVTNGVYVPIAWKKTSSLSPTQWTFEDGTPLTINVGKTWVCVLSNSREPIFE